jgi:hypothetical protein
MFVGESTKRKAKSTILEVDSTELRFELTVENG